MTRRIFAAVLFACCVACGGEQAPPQIGERSDAGTATPPGPPDPVHEAKVSLPAFLDLQQKVISRTCSPNPGVCHQTNNSPDLGSGAGTLLAIFAPCNVDNPEPELGWDRCERAPDRVVAGNFRSDIAWVQRTPNEHGVWTIALRDAPAFSESRVVRIESARGETVVDFSTAEVDGDPWLELSFVEGTRTATAALRASTSSNELYVRLVYATLLDRVVEGDRNRNGVFGADAGGRAFASLIAPGDLEASYLWRRITGTAPGARMPLANQPLSNAEYVAIACWIEGLARTANPTTGDVIDYDRCAFARDPELLSVTGL